MLETESEFLVKKWGGTILSVAVALGGVLSMITQKSYFPQGGQRVGRGVIELTGQQAVFAGVAYLGIGIALFAHFFLPYSERLFRWERPVFVVGLVMGIIGIALVFWRFVMPE
ncbi:MAG: hypothetical protein HRU46_14265 [Verrucomicrobiales bacterium]|nr:hypothetical protein [Verrucomicrobiales bacterium]